MRPLLLLFFAVTNTHAVDSMQANRIISEAHDKGDFDGVVVISEGGKVVFESAIGTSDRAARTRMEPTTVFRLASLTKQVTALLIMQQVEAGKLTLDQKPAPGLPQATVRQLLQHTSGLPNPSDGPEGTIPHFYQRAEEAAADVTKNAKSFCSGTPKRAPGGSFEYNNCDYIVLGALLEQVTGKKFSDLVHERVIEPLGLRSWGTYPADARKAPAVALTAKEPHQNPATYGSAGALYGDALDVAKWDEALLNHRLLSPELTAIMFRADPKLQGEALGSWSYDLPKSDPKLHLIERQGDLGSTRVLNLLLPDLDASIVILANSDRADLFDTYSRKGLGFALLQTLGKNHTATSH